MSKYKRRYRIFVRKVRRVLNTTARLCNLVYTLAVLALFGGMAAFGIKYDIWVLWAIPALSLFMQFARIGFIINMTGCDTDDEEDKRDID